MGMKTVAFSVYGPGIVNIVRDLMIEGRDDKALNILACFPITVAQGRKILEGEATIKGTSPDLEYVEEVDKNYKKRLESQRLFRQRKARADLERDFLEDLYEESPGKMTVQEGEWVPPKPQEDPNLKATNGWIAPNGTFYQCYYMGHNDLASQIVYHVLNKRNLPVDDSQYLENNGAIKIQEGAGDRTPWFFLPRDSQRNQVRPPEQVLRTLFDYCEKHGIRFPYDELEAL